MVRVGKKRGTNVKCAENDGSRITKQPGTVKFMSHTFTHNHLEQYARAIVELVRVLRVKIEQNESERDCRFE